MEADDLLEGDFGSIVGQPAVPPVILTCDDEDVSSVATLEESSRQMSTSNVMGLSSVASVSGVAALEDTSVNMSIE